jgi:hypothetical protein
MILRNVDISTIEHKRAPLWWQKQGLMYSSTGYGRKIPTELMVRLPGNSRWRRVYVCCFSNAGTAYVLQGKDWIVIDGTPNC